MGLRDISACIAIASFWSLITCIAVEVGINLTFAVIIDLVGIITTVLAVSKWIMQ